MVDRGELVRLRRGAYVSTASERTNVDPHELRDDHVRLIAGDPVRSFILARRDQPRLGAAVIHDLPLFSRMLDTSTRPAIGGWGASPCRTLRSTGPSSGTSIARRRRAPCDIPGAHGGGYRARCCRTTKPWLWPTGAWRRDVTQSDLAERLDQAKVLAGRGPGAAGHRLSRTDGSESVGESFSRMRNQPGRPAGSPLLQFEVFDDNGRWSVAVTSSGPHAGQVGEFDGLDRSTDDSETGETAEPGGAPREAA